MDIPDISTLRLQNIEITEEVPSIPDDIADVSNVDTAKLKNYARCIPYSIEANYTMQKMLDLILLRVTQCVEAKDYDPGLVQWDSMFTYWCMLKYPIPKQKRISLAKLYFHICTTPGMPTSIVAVCADTLRILMRSKRKLGIKDMRLPWKPVFNILSKDLFLTRRQFEISLTSWYMGYIAETSSRFFHPAAIDEMLATFVPMMNGSSLNTILASQYYILTFLPLSHPQSYIPMLFRTWESMNSHMFDERMLQFLSSLAEMHVDPTVSDPKKIQEIPDDTRSNDEGRPNWSKNDLDTKWQWTGLYKDVGIFTEHDWSFIMSKCLASMEIHLADTGSLSTGSSADNSAGFELSRLPKPTWRIVSLARIIVYSMAPDSVPSPGSTTSTPTLTPTGSGTSTPLPHHSSGLADYLSAPLGKGGHLKVKTYLAGSKALDSLIKMIASCEGFFHPTNSGSWTSDLSAFIKFIVYDFNKRWHEEQKPDCKTPLHRRLTRDMKRELVKSLRTVTLLAMFSQDHATVSNIQSCIKSMSIMEPDLILLPIIERAVPALEALVETQRTISVIKALGAVVPALVCREVYYPGAKHLIPILELLLPGIDLNDPEKTLCTVSFIIEVSQYIKMGEMMRTESSLGMEFDTVPSVSSRLPALDINNFPEGIEDPTEANFTREEEDTILKNTSGSFADWVASFLRRVILLFENLPEEGANDAGGTSEARLVDAVCAAFSQICVHLSEPLYDMVLNMVFDYASSNVRSNSVRAIHQLVECVANANPGKTLARFVPFCMSNISTELDHGASSLRTTSASSTPLPSDATLHWNLAILRGSMYNDGRACLLYKRELLAGFQMLHKKTLSQRGFSSTGKLLSSTLLTLTHTYPLENRFVNPDEWNSKEFVTDHHKYWGKMYNADDVQLSWHVPSLEEIEFALELFKDLVEPTLITLDKLLAPDVVRDAVWRNDFCRHLSLIYNAFSGIPTMIKDFVPPAELPAAYDTSDILNEIPEMIASIQPLNAGFSLSDPADPRYQYVVSLKKRFGEFLHRASQSLRQQGEENTVDAVHMLIRSIRTYLLDYGDSGDSYYLQLENYTSERDVARQYGGQKVWPRAIHVRRARLYNAARLHWHSIERRRGLLEDQLIDDVTEWSMWHYVTVRMSSQSLLESICVGYDGVRRRALPVLYKALQPGTDDDRMKGALWTLNKNVFAKYVMAEPTLTTDFVKHLFQCQHNERPSIQDYVADLSKTCLSAFAEPRNLIYEIDNDDLVSALADMRACLPRELDDELIVKKCTNKRIERIALMEDAWMRTTDIIINIANSEKTHWRYAIVAVRCLRTLVRIDRPLCASHVQCLLQQTYSSNASIRYYAHRAILKISRFIKIRTFSRGPVDLALERTQNPLRRQLPIADRSHEFTSQWLSAFKIPLDFDRASYEPLLHEKPRSGWVAWKDSDDGYLMPPAKESPLLPWDSESQDALQAIREIAMQASFWKELSTHYSAENQTEVISQNNVPLVKSIFQLLEDEPWGALLPTLEELLANKEKNKQRGAAEFIAGVLAGSKHWPTDKQLELWQWFSPRLDAIFGHLKNDTLPIWTSFIEYIFHNKDPRRVQPLVDYIMNQINTVDFNSEFAFDVVTVLSLFRAFYESLGWKFSPWADDIMQQCWSEINSEHDDVLAYISELFSFCDKVMWHPTPSVPTAEVFVRECRTLRPDSDIMGIRGFFHEGRVLELVKKFSTWRGERLPGARAFQSTYDRVGVLVCRWLFQTIHDTNATSAFDCLLPLMPEIFRFTELNDNDDLSYRAKVLLVRMCGVTPPRPLIEPVLDAIFAGIQTSHSWRVRLKILPLVQVYYFRQGPLISEKKVVSMMEVVCACLDDEVVEVREMAATTLSGILRVSPRRSIIALRDRFVRLLRHGALPDRRAPTYAVALRQRHAAILGICALVDSYPYTVEAWLPDLLTNVLVEHTYDPIPIATTVRKCARNFRKTHQDTWHEDAKRFTEHQLAALSTLLTGSSYYA